MQKKILASILGLSVLSAFILLAFLIWDIREDMNAYFLQVGELERAVIANVPIYEDFASPEKEKKLRTYLQNDHMAAAQSAGIEPVTDESRLPELIRSGSLVSIDTGERSLHFFYNVRKPLRVLTPESARGLKMITERLQEKLRKRAPVTPVKIAVSSALRPSLYQRDLGTKNMNATVQSTHSYGTSFDIFYDEFFLTPPVPENANLASRSIMKNMRQRMGYLLGASLRRQFHAMLMETLIELQDEGAIYAILERRQRCYHVTVLKQ